MYVAQSPPSSVCIFPMSFLRCVFISCINAWVCMWVLFYPCLSVSISNSLHLCLSVSISNSLHLCLSVSISNSLHLCLSSQTNSFFMSLYVSPILSLLAISSLYVYIFDNVSLYTLLYISPPIFVLHYLSLFSLCKSLSMFFYLNLSHSLSFCVHLSY